MRHELNSGHREHLENIGIPVAPPVLDIPDHEYNEHYENWRRTLPHAGHAVWHQKALANHAWKQHVRQEAGNAEAADRWHRVHAQHFPVRDSWIKRLLKLVGLAALLFIVTPAHAQFSHVNYVNFQAAGSNISGAFFTYPFNINCLANLSCTVSGNTLSINATSGGTGCTIQGGTNLLLYDTSTSCNDITKWQTNGTTTLTGLATAILDLSAAATFKPPQATAPTVEGTSAFNTTSHLPVWGFNGASTTTIPLTLANASHKWVNSYDQTTGTLTQTQPDYSDLSGVPSTFAPTPHNILSASHGDTTAAAAVRGDGFFAIGATPTWQRLAHPTTSGGYFKWNGTDIVASTGAASGTGTPTACSNQFVTSLTLNADAAPTSSCTTATLASAQFANQGTTVTLLHGNAAGNPAFGSVVSADLNITTTTCTNQFVTAISAAAAGTCTTDTLAGAQHANQGTTTTLLHGNGAGNPSFGSVVSADMNITTTTCTNQFLTAISATGTGTCTTDTLASAQHANQGTTTTVLHGNAAGNPSFAAVTSADTTGTFAATAHNLLSATHGDTTTGSVARGDLVTGQGASPTWTRLAKGSASQCLEMDGSAVDVVWAACSSGTGDVTDVGDCSTGACFTSAGTGTTLTFHNATSGTLALAPVTGALGSATIAVPIGVGNATLTQTIANGTKALATGAIASGACTTAQTATATGTLTSDDIMADFSADPTAVTGYAPSSSGMLTIIKYPTADTVNFKVCNNTASSITPGAITLNFRVVR